jgi:hypothetical protein
MNQTEPHTPHWKLCNFEEGILRSVCQVCGAVRFEPVDYYELKNSPDSTITIATLKRLKELNKTQGKEGNHVTVKIEDLKGPESIREIIASAEKTGLPPVPPKPAERKAVHSYYEQNKEQIIADYHRILKNADFLKRWGLTSSTWWQLRTRWSVPLKNHDKPDTIQITAKQLENITNNIPEITKAVPVIAPALYDRLEKKLDTVLDRIDCIDQVVADLASRGLADEKLKLAIIKCINQSTLLADDKAILILQAIQVLEGV